VLVVNTTGELRDWYHLATVVFIGKSLAAQPTLIAQAEQWKHTLGWTM
jgi:hypothetical protein